MRPYKSDIYKPNCKLNHGDQTEIISFDIEYITLIAYIINAIEGLFYIREATPFAVPNPAKQPLILGASRRIP